MRYTQKYCLVAFIDPVEVGIEFSMKDWPLHVTLVDVFAIDLQGTDLNEKLRSLLERTLPFAVVAQQEATLGTTKVVLLEKNQEIIKLHTLLIDLLESNAAVLNTPEFARKGFLPHSTIQNAARVQTGDNIAINTISLVDMLPDNNWRQRRVLSTFKLARG